MKFLFAGDLNISSTMPTIDEHLKAECSNSDVVCVNLEGAICFDHPPSEKAGPNLSQSASIRDFLGLCEVNLLNTANNHILDFGSEAAERTVSYLGISHVGHRFRSDDWVQWFTDEFGQKIAVISGSESFEGSVDRLDQTGFLRLQSESFRTLVADVSSTADFLFVVAHCGLEDVALPLPEWRETYHDLVHLGASVIIGHHPHVVQPVELYQGSMIFYSLGNFFMPPEYGGTDSSGLMVKIETIGGGLLSADQYSITNSEHIQITESHPVIDNFPEQNLYAADISSECRKITENSLLPGISDVVNGVGHQPNLRSLQQVFSSMLARKYVRTNPEVLLSRYRYLEHLFRVESNRWCIERGLQEMLCADS